MNELELKNNLLKYARMAVTIAKQNHDNLDIEAKSSYRDLVTNVDRLVERTLVAAILEDYPNATIISEEYHHETPDKLEGLIFFVDPIDGTLNFVHQHDHFASMIGVYLDDKPIAGIIVDIPNENYYYGTEKLGIFKNDGQLKELPNLPINEGLVSVGGGMIMNNSYQITELVKKSLGLRILGSAGIEFTELLDGKQIAYITRLAPWDLAAGKFLVEKLGLKVTKIDGTRPSMLKSETVIISTKQLHEIAIEHLHDKL